GDVVDFAAVADPADRVDVRAFAGDEQALRVFGILRRDVDDAVDRVGAPEGGAGAADHLDPVEVGHDVIERVPVDAGEQRRVHAAAVHHHQQLVGVQVVEAARADRPLAGVDAGDVEAGDEPQQLGD